MSSLEKLQMSSLASSQKVLLQGSGSFVVPALGGAGNLFASAVIPHGYGDDNLIFQVATDSAAINGINLPWDSGDGRVAQYAQLDATNLEIFFLSSDASGFGAPSYTVNYAYRILIP